MLTTPVASASDTTTSTTSLIDDDETTIEMNQLLPGPLLENDTVVDGGVGVGVVVDGVLMPGVLDGDDNGTCYGAPEYCNMTRTEYEEMLAEFIQPRWPGMLLIGAHTVVFVMGLVSGVWVVF